jgi:hypothetical protein
MSEPYAIYNLPIRVRGDSWRGIPSITITINGEVPTVAAAVARMQFRQNKENGKAGLSLSSENDTITIVDAVDWIFSVPAINNFPLGAGDWDYDFEVTDVTGYRRTFFAGTVTIRQDSTQ